MKQKTLFFMRKIQNLRKIFILVILLAIKYFLISTLCQFFKNGQTLINYALFVQIKTFYNMIVFNFQSEIFNG